MSDSPEDILSIRLDKWLWAARFFKTRALAIHAADTGRVEVNGERAKPSRAIKVGDRLHIRKGPFHYQVTVLGLSLRRGPATEAQLLYEETPESIAARAVVADQLRQLPQPEFKGRPTKRARRHIIRFTQGGD